MKYFTYSLFLSLLQLIERNRPNWHQFRNEDFHMVFFKWQIQTSLILFQETVAQVEAHTQAQSQPQVYRSELVPRLCHLVRSETGYGFNLHSDRSRPGQYIRSLDPGSPADHAGLRPQDRLVEVRWWCVDEGGCRREKYVAGNKMQSSTVILPLLKFLLTLSARYYIYINI